MIRVIPPMDSFAEDSNYPASAHGHSMQNGLKSVSNSRLPTGEQPVTMTSLEDPNEKDILELLQQMDEFEPIVSI